MERRIDMEKMLLRMWIDKDKMKKLHKIKDRTGITMTSLVNSTIDHIIDREARKRAKVLNTIVEKGQVKNEG